MIQFYNIIVLLSIVLVVSCSQPSKETVGNRIDYDKYLSFKDTVDFNRNKRELEYWNTRVEQKPEEYLYLSHLAKAHEALYAYDGDINHINKAEEYYGKILEEGNPRQVGVLHALCRNYISKHKFKECLPLLGKAKSTGQKKEITNQLFFDVYLELGNIHKANTYLEAIKKPNSFNYFIRKAKWEDHQGNLDKAIQFLELAKKRAIEQNNKTFKIWSYSNLGDFYGHQGSIQSSYEQYLKVLALDPSNTYVLKNIGWIQYAYNHNPKEANRILDSILKFKQTPDLYLLKAELATFSKDFVFSKIYENMFLELASNRAYGDMYNTYVIDLLVSKNKNLSKAVVLAKKEVFNRPTAMSYDWLAWSYLHSGEKEKALEIIEKYVENAIHEPVALYHTAKIYKANNYNFKRIEDIKSELLEASFELGLLMDLEVKKL